MCKCVGCHRKLENPYFFCSITCACLAGYFSVTKGWLKDSSELNNKEMYNKLINKGPFRDYPEKKDYL